MRVCLFEDHVDTLQPLSLTRPVFDLRCGLTTLAEKTFRCLQARDRGVLLRPMLADLYWTENPGVVCNDPRWLGESVALLVNGRWLAPGAAPTLPDTSCVGLIDGEIAYVKLSAEQLRFVSPPSLPEWLEHWKKTLPAHDAAGALVRYPWQLVEANGRHIVQDFAAGMGEPSAVGSHVGLVGSRDQLWLHPSARIDPMVVADTTCGPVVIDREAVVDAFTRLEGPCYIGPRTRVLGGKIRAGTTLGPDCRVGGEVEASVLQGCVNKYHEGFLGHSYVGAWVNLAAGTHTSDLRCDYGEVTMTVSGRKVATGLRKVGAFIGDHTRTGLGVLLNTGTTIGAGCMLLPAAGFAPRVVPSFSRWSGDGLSEGPGIDEAAATAQIVMQRRGKSFTSQHREVLERVWSETALERKQTLRAWEQRRLRRSA